MCYKLYFHWITPYDGLELCRAAPANQHPPAKAKLWPRPKFTTLLILLRAECHHGAAGAVIVDPMCGSGTILIEAALMASHIAPGAQFVTILVYGEAVRSTWEARLLCHFAYDTHSTTCTGQPAANAAGTRQCHALGAGRAVPEPAAAPCRPWCEILLPKTSDVIFCTHLSCTCPAPQGCSGRPGPSSSGPTLTHAPGALRRRWRRRRGGRGPAPPWAPMFTRAPSAWRSGKSFVLLQFIEEA